MNEDLKQTLVEAMIDYDTRKTISQNRHVKTNEKKAMEFSKKLILGTLMFISLVCIASMLSWFLIGEWPREVAEFFIWPFIVAITGYMGKSAYENKAKILGREDRKK